MQHHNYKQNRICGTADKSTTLINFPHIFTLTEHSSWHHIMI